MYCDSRNAIRGWILRSPLTADQLSLHQNTERCCFLVHLGVRRVCLFARLGGWRSGQR